MYLKCQISCKVMRGRFAAGVQCCYWCLYGMLLRMLQWLEHLEHFVPDEMTELMQ